MFDVKVNPFIHKDDNANPNSKAFQPEICYMRIEFVSQAHTIILYFTFSSNGFTLKGHFCGGISCLALLCNPFSFGIKSTFLLDENNAG